MVDFQTKGMKFCDHKVMLETFITMAYSPLFQSQYGCGVISIMYKEKMIKPFSYGFKFDIPCMPFYVTINCIAICDCLL